MPGEFISDMSIISVDMPFQVVEDSLDFSRA